MTKHRVDATTIAQAREGYVPVNVAVELLSRNSHTLRTWVWRRQVEHRRIDGVVYLHLRQAAKLSAQSVDLERRRRAEWVAAQHDGLT